MDGKGKRMQAKLPAKTDTWNNRYRKVSTFMAPSLAMLRLPREFHFEQIVPVGLHERSFKT